MVTYEKRKIVFVIPMYEDLWLREKWLSNEQTMSFNHAYGGTISFSQEKWAKWYKKWVEDSSSEYFYRYIKDVSTNGIVGEVAYHYDLKTKRYLCDILIDAQYRKKGYGKLALNLLVECAKKRGIKQFYDDIAIDNPAIDLFLKYGFKKITTTKEYLTVCLEM